MLNESSRPTHVTYRIPGGTGRGGGSSKLALQLSSKRKAKPGYGSSEGLTLGITPLNRGTRSVLSASS